MDAAEALQRLVDGNARYVAGEGRAVRVSGPERRARLVDEQHPRAIVLGCSDSRVPVEIVFDQGLGELFVIRVAGNIVAPSLVGSVEFAAEQFGTRLVVVLGHSQCSAVASTLAELRRESASQSPNLRSIVERIRPGVEGLLDGGACGDDDERLRLAIRANIRASVDQLRRGSAILESLVARAGLRVVGAEYSLESGVVEFLPETL